MRSWLQALSTPSRYDAALQILSCEDLQELEILRKSASDLTFLHSQNHVFLRGLIEFSNLCVKNCNYCGIRKSRKTNRYQIPENEFETIALSLVQHNLKTIVIQSGENPHSDADLLEMIARIKAHTKDIAITLSVGERSEKEYIRFKEAGANRFLLRIETTEPSLFASIHPDDDLEMRKDCLKTLQKLGFETGSGIMVGLPSQSLESIVKDLFWFEEMQFPMIGLGPFIPHESTPMKFENPGSFELTLKILALLRHLLPKANIPATTAMGSLRKHGRATALCWGANVLMPNCTPTLFRDQYTLYNGKIGLASCATDSIEDARSEALLVGKIAV